VHVDLGATALTIPAGARLRLEVSSGNFPKYDRNPQTGESPLTATTLRPATHRVHHGERYPSALSVWLRP
jgi:predicted acyl esterase